MGLLLNIEEFEIDNSHNTGNNLDSNKILLPNENTTNTKPLKSLKYNYISTIKPKIIKNISGNITNLNNLLFNACKYH